MLATAVNNRKTNLVKLLLEKGADPNARATTSLMPRSVLADAVMMGQTDVAKELVRAGANPNVCSNEDAGGKCASDGLPVIFLAPMDPELFRMMVAKGANPNAEDMHGQTALGYALSYRTHHEYGPREICQAGTTNCKVIKEQFDITAAVRLLLDAGANPNKKSGGKLPLTMADDSDHEAIMLLLDKGAYMEILSAEGEQIGPISQAATSHRYFLASELLRRTKGKLRSDEKWALYAGATEGKRDLVEALVQHGIDPDERGPLGETALHYAAINGNSAMVKRLLALGANPNAQTDAMPQVVALSSEALAILLALTKASEAQMKAYEAQMRIKQKKYAAAGLSPPLGIWGGKTTPLMLAVASGDVEVARALLDGGAKISTKSQQGLSALDIANRQGNHEMERLLTGRYKVE